MQVRRNRVLADPPPSSEQTERPRDGVLLAAVVPLYQERELAADTARFWHGLAARGLIDLVVLVTTAKESAPEDGVDTHALAAAELERIGGEQERIVLLRCEQVARFRAVQLNLAVEHARKTMLAEGAAASRLWIGVYNADSRPQPATFAELAERVESDPQTRVFQQLVDYVKPDRDATGVAADGNAVLQTWWTLSHYVARSRRARSGFALWARTSPYSTFGHGEWIRADTLERIGGFPDFAYADGLLLGWIAVLAGERIGLLAARDIAEVPRSAKDLVTQQGAWMRGLLNFPETLEWCREQGILALTDRQARLLALHHRVIPAAWGLSSAAWAAAITRILARARRGESSAGDLWTMAGLVTYPVIPALVPATQQQLRTATARRLAGTLASWPCEGLGYWPALRAHLAGDQHAPVKTPR